MVIKLIFEGNKKLVRNKRMLESPGVINNTSWGSFMIPKGATVPDTEVVLEEEETTMIVELNEYQINATPSGTALRIAFPGMPPKKREEKFAKLEMANKLRLHADDWLNDTGAKSFAIMQ